MKKASNRPCPCKGGTLVRFLQPLILAALSKEPCHGYVLMQKISATRLWQDEAPDPAGVYRTLRDMESRGLIVSATGAQQPAGLGRRVFTLTPQGELCRRSWLETLCKYRQGINEVIEILSDFESPDSL